MNKLSLLGAVILATACTPVPADTSAPINNGEPIPYVTSSTYSCNPSTFQLVQTSVLDTGAQYELSGMLEMPTPGYTYEFIPQPSLTADHHVYNLRFTKPEGPVIQMTQNMEIKYAFGAVPYLKDLQVMLRNQANWHPKTISCRVQPK